jgi:2'-5' RNA ligase
MVRTEIADLRSPALDATWTPVDNLHLTLRFIGDVDAARQEAFESALQRVRVEPFILPVKGVGIFPTRGRSKIVWTGFGTAHPRLFQLRKQVDDALLSVDAGLDVSSFHPHVTLAQLHRDYDSKSLVKYLEANAEFEAPPFRVREFHLMSSELGASHAPRYDSVKPFALLET